MKTRKIFASLLAAVLVLTLPVLSLAEGTYGAAAVDEGNTYTLAQMLTYAIQDEYLAQATYGAVISTFSAERPYVNIIKAEGRHVEALKTLFAAYGIAVPENTAAGLVTLPATLAETYPLEAQVEVSNIAMYAAFLKQSDLPDDVKGVFTALMNGSENHLAAFEKQVGNTNGTGVGNRGNMPGNGKATNDTNGAQDGSGRYGASNGIGGQNGNGTQNGNGMQNGRGNRNENRNRMNTQNCTCGACPHN